MTLFVHIANEKIDILIIGNRQSDSSNDTLMAAEKKYSKILLSHGRNFV